MHTPLLVVLFDVERSGRQIIREVIGAVADILYLPDVEAAARAEVLQRATVIFAQNTAKELTPDELALIRKVRLLQFYTAGVDFLPLQNLPADLPIATNGGAFAEPMAEHALALTLAATKRLFFEHCQLATGAFNQFTPNRMLAGRVCGIFGFGRIGARELALLPADTILVNLARGEIIEEGALLAHLRAHPTFTACLDAWWVEPVRHGAFRMQYPFLELPNVIGSPHNSASVGGWHQVALRRAAENCRRALTGEPPQGVIGPDERLQ